MNYSHHESVFRIFVIEAAKKKKKAEADKKKQTRKAAAGKQPKTNIPKNTKQGGKGAGRVGGKR